LLFFKTERHYLQQSLSFFLRLFAIHWSTKKEKMVKHKFLSLGSTEIGENWRMGVGIERETKAIEEARLWSQVERTKNIRASRAAG